MTVQVGGVRTGPTAVGPSPVGAMLGLFTAYTATPTVGTATVTCTNAADGSCVFNVPAASIGQSYWVEQISAPPGWFTNPILRIGGNTAATSQPVPYAFQTPTLAANTAYTYQDYTNATGNQVTTGVWQQSLNNPDLVERCGLRVALVLDLSTSVGYPTNHLPDLKAAADQFSASLSGTPSSMALFTFSTNSPANAGSPNYPVLQPVSTPQGLATFQSRYANATSSGSTNWDQALWTVQQADLTQHYDLVVVITDGNPTTSGPTGNPLGATTYFSHVENGIFSANAIKALGTRIVVAGVGTQLEDPSERYNLISISGPTVGSDFYQTDDYEQAGADLAALATSRCEGTLSVVKQIAPPNTIGEDVTGAVPAGPGWQLTAAGQSAGVSVPDPVQTTTDDGSGTVNFVPVYSGVDSGVISVNELQQTSFENVTQGGQVAQCRTVAAESEPVPLVSQDTNPAAPGFAVNVPRDVAVTCTIYNRGPLTGSLAVDKDWIVNGETFPEGSQPSGLEAEVTLTGPGEAGASAQPIGVPRPGYQLGETATVDESTQVTATGCRLDSSRLTESNGTAVDAALPYEQRIDQTDNTVKVTNAVSCGAVLSLVKRVDNVFGGTAGPDRWTLTADGPTPVRGVSVDSEAVQPGRYVLGETGGPAGYRASGWSCRNEPDGSAVPVTDGDRIDLPHGAAVRCELTNTQLSTGALAATGLTGFPSTAGAAAALTVACACLTGLLLLLPPGAAWK